MRYRLCGPQASPFPSLRGVQISSVAGLGCQGPTASFPQIQVKPTAAPAGGPVWAGPGLATEPLFRVLLAFKKGS